MGLYKRTGSPFWQYRFTKDGRTYTGSTKTAHKREAKRVEAAARARLSIRSSGVRSGRSNMTLLEARDRYLTEKSATCSTVSDMTSKLRLSTKMLGERLNLRDIGDHEISVLVRRRAAAGVSVATTNRDVAMLRAVFRSATMRWGIELPNAPHFSVHMKPEPDARDRYLTQEEADKLVRELPAKVKAPVRFALLTGLRRGDIESLTWKQVDFATGMMTFKVKSRRPGGKTHRLPITKGIKAILMAVGPKPEGRVFEGSHSGDHWLREIAKAAKRLDIPPLRFHDLRHTAASWMVQKGVPLEVVKEILGHENITTTLRYAHHKTDVKRKAMEAALGGASGPFVA